METDDVDNKVKINRSDSTIYATNEIIQSLCDLVVDIGVDVTHTFDHVPQPTNSKHGQMDEVHRPQQSQEIETHENHNWLRRRRL